MVVDKAEQEFPIVRGEFFHEFLAYQLRNLNRILIFICYTHHQIHEPAWWLKGGDSRALDMW